MTAMSLGATLFFIGLLLCSMVLYRLVTTPSYRCFFCGTRTGEHESTCPWSR